VSSTSTQIAFAFTSGRSGRVRWPDRLGVKPLTGPRFRNALRFGLVAACAGGRGRREATEIDPVRCTTSEFPRGGARPAPSCAGSRNSRRHRHGIEPDGTRTEHTYWEPVFERSPERESWSESEWEEAILASLRTAVERRLVADVPVGCLLSGGLDSSLIVGLLAEAGQHGLATFSIGFEAAVGRRATSFKYSDIIARHYGTTTTRSDRTARMLPALRRHHVRNERTDDEP
jgi:asparagine synthase (glutamine-hydrolysing)